LESQLPANHALLLHSAELELQLADAIDLRPKILATPAVTGSAFNQFLTSNANPATQSFGDMASAVIKAVSDNPMEFANDNLNYLARPGDQVVVIRKPWPIGHWGKVVAFREFNPCYFRIELELQGKIIFVPASALARWVGAPDCEKAELQNIYLLMKINGLKLAH
jgi:hypothetical protein